METLFGIKGTCELVLTDIWMQKTKRLVIPNMITNNGLNKLAKAILYAAGSSNYMGAPYIAVGEGTGLSPNPSPTDTILANELGAGSRSIVLSENLTLQNNIAQFTALFSVGIGNATGLNEINEAGLFWDDGASGTKDTGTLVSRVKIEPSLAKDKYKTLAVHWYYELSRKF